MSPQLKSVKVKLDTPPYTMKLLFLSSSSTYRTSGASKNSDWTTFSVVICLYRFICNFEECMYVFWTTCKFKFKSGSRKITTNVVPLCTSEMPERGVGGSEGSNCPISPVFGRPINPIPSRLCPPHYYPSAPPPSSDFMESAASLYLHGAPFSQLKRPF